MTCPHASSGCNGPKEGECLGLCTHRVHRINTEAISKDCSVIYVTTPIAYAKGSENESKFSRCMRAYRAYRLHGRFAAIKRFIKEWRAK